MLRSLERGSLTLAPIIIYIFWSQPVTWQHVCVMSVIMRGRIRRRTHPPAEAGFLRLSRACGRTRAIEYESQVSNHFSGRMGWVCCCTRIVLIFCTWLVTTRYSCVGSGIHSLETPVIRAMGVHLQAVDFMGFDSMWGHHLVEWSIGKNATTKQFIGHMLLAYCPEQVSILFTAQEEIWWGIHTDDVLEGSNYLSVSACPQLQWADIVADLKLLNSSKVSILVYNVYK